MKKLLSVLIAATFAATSVAAFSAEKMKESDYAKESQKDTKKKKEATHAKESKKKKEATHAKESMKESDHAKESMKEPAKQ